MPGPLPFSLVVVSHFGERRDITSVSDALDMLLRWPLKSKGMAYRAARRSCLDALAGNATTTSARNAFIRAAVEADIIVRTVEGKPLEGMVDAKPFALVVVKTSYAGHLRNINSVSDAAEALAGDWPMRRRRPAYRAAIRACRDALAGTVTPDVARQAFIAAAQEVEIFVRG